MERFMISDDPVLRQREIVKDRTYV